MQYTFTLTEVNNWVGGDGAQKVKAMLVNGWSLTLKSVMAWVCC